MSAKSKAKKPLGPVLDFEAVIAELNTRPLPPEADYFESDPPRRLVGLCKILQEHAGMRRFFWRAEKPRQPSVWHTRKLPITCRHWWESAC